MSVTAPLWLAILQGLVVIAATWVPFRRQASPWRLTASVAAAVFLWALLVDLRLGLERSAITLSTPGDPQAATGAQRLRWPEAVISPSQIAHRFPAVGAANVTGHGLPSLAWLEAPGLDVAFDAGPGPDRPIAHWPGRLHLGLPLIVQGRLPLTARQVRLVLPGAGGLEIDATTPQRDGTFSLRATPPAPGRYLFLMEVATAGGAEYSEPVAVEVTEPPRIRVRFELSRPSYEARALKNWMVDAGVDGEFVASLAPDVQRREKLGDGLGGAAPDLWIGDPAALDAMSQASRTQWQEQLRDGMGTLILLDSPQSDLPEAAEMQARPPDPQTVTTGAEDLPVTLAARLDGGGVPLAAGSAGQVIIAATAVGRGRVGASTALDTHKWKTRFGPEPYAAFWSPVVRHLARRRTPEVTLTHAEGVATAGFATRICIHGGAPPSGLAEQHLLLPSTAPDPDGCHTWWPSSPGWNFWPELRSVYVYDRTDWSGWRAALRTAATGRRAASNPERPVDSIPADRRFQWWLLLLVSILALWISEGIPRAENRDMAK